MCSSCLAEFLHFSYHFPYGVSINILNMSVDKSAKVMTRIDYTFL